MSRNCSANGTPGSLGTRDSCPDSSFTGSQAAAAASLQSLHQQQGTHITDLIYQELTGRGAPPLPFIAHKANHQGTPEGRLRGLTATCHVLCAHTRVSEAPAKCHVGLTHLKPPFPTALTQLSLSSDSPMCSMGDIFKNQQKRLKHVLLGPIYSSQACEFTRYSSSSSIKNRLS